MPALLFLLHGRGVGTDPSAGADLVSVPAAVLPARAPSTAKPSSQSTSSVPSSKTCSAPCNVRHSTSPAYAAPTSRRGSPNFHPPPCPDTSDVCAISASSNASAEPIATTSLRSVAPPSQPAATSPKTSSFRLSHDNFFTQNVKTQLTRDKTQLTRDYRPL